MLSATCLTCCAALPVLVHHKATVPGWSSVRLHEPDWRLLAAQPGCPLALACLPSTCFVRKAGGLACIHLRLSAEGLQREHHHIPPFQPMCLASSGSVPTYCSCLCAVQRYMLYFTSTVAYVQCSATSSSSQVCMSGKACILQGNNRSLLKTDKPGDS